MQKVADANELIMINNAQEQKFIAEQQSLYYRGQIEQNEEIMNEQKPYAIKKNSCYRTKKQCSTMAFNKEQTIMVAGFESIIIVFDFINGELSENQTLSCGSMWIASLCFMQNENKLISGSREGDIQIWDCDQQWNCQQLLKEAHSDKVNSVIMNKNEDLMISCSNDQTIKFWIKRDEWELYQTLNNQSGQVYSISLNESCTQLVSCDEGGNILIYCCDQKWRKLQRIQSEWGYRIYFIDDDFIAYQQANETKIQLYELDQENKLFVKFKDIPVQNDWICERRFRMTFNSKKKFLLNKNQNTIDSIMKKNNDFVIEQSTSFNGMQLHATMTDDGEYVVTWDTISWGFKVWQQL